MPKRKLSDLTESASASTPDSGSANPSQKKDKLANEQHYAQLKLQTTRLKQKFDFGVTSLSRALKTARGFERQKLGRRQKTVKNPDAEQDENAHGKSKNKNKWKLSPEENAKRIEGEIAVLKSLDPTITAQKYLFKQLSKIKRIAESPVFYRFKQSQSKKIPLEGPKSTEEANVMARLFKSNPVQKVLPEIMNGLKDLFGLEGGNKGKSKKDGKTSSAKGDGKPGKAEQSAEPDISASEDSGDEAPVARDMDMDVDMSGSESGEEDYAQFDARLASDSEEDDDGEDEFTSKSRPPPRSSMSISLSPAPSRSPSPPPKKAKSQAKTQDKTPASSTTFLPSLMMGGYWSGSEEEDGEGPEEIDEAPKRKNRMGQQARRALWEKKYGAAANHVKDQSKKGKNGGKGGRDSGWDLRKGATGDEGRDRGSKKFLTGSNAMAMVGDSKVGVKRQKPQPKDDKPLHPSWEAARKAKEQKATAAFQGKKMVFD
ncbi:Bud-site selection protein [Aspergillus unguis]